MRNFISLGYWMSVGIILLLQACSFHQKENTDYIYNDSESIEKVGLLLSAPMGMAKSAPMKTEAFGLIIGNPEIDSMNGISSFRMYPVKADYDPFVTIVDYSEKGFQFKEANSIEPGFQSFQFEENVQLDQIALNDLLLQRFIFNEQPSARLLFDFAPTQPDSSREVYLISEDGGWIKGYILDKSKEEYSRIFFFIRFSVPFSEVRIHEEGKWFLQLNREFRGNDLKSLFIFPEGVDTLMVKYGFSTASLDAAYDASQSVLKWKFDQEKTKSKALWIGAFGVNPKEKMSDDELSQVYHSRFQYLNKIWLISDRYDEYYFEEGQIKRSPHFSRYTSSNPRTDFYEISRFSSANPTLREDLAISLICELGMENQISEWIDQLGRRPEGSEILDFVKNPAHSLDTSSMDAVVGILNPGYLD